MVGDDDVYLLTYVNKHEELIDRGGDLVTIISTACVYRMVTYL